MGRSWREKSQDLEILGPMGPFATHLSDGHSIIGGGTSDSCLQNQKETMGPTAKAG
jgi:hypothetical protein